MVGNFGGSHYYILDFTQPVVEQTLQALVRNLSGDTSLTCSSSILVMSFLH